VTLIVPGGGGFGNPKERARDKVFEDVALGFVSAESAKDIYGVSDPIDVQSLQQDALKQAVAEQKARSQS
jgi:N-methylhydantoinase B/oxoprolinase/acetone carboxylase alpha subunit